MKLSKPLWSIGDSVHYLVTDNSVHKTFCVRAVVVSEIHKNEDDQYAWWEIEFHDGSRAIVRSNRLMPINQA